MGTYYIPICFLWLGSWWPKIYEQIQLLNRHHQIMDSNNIEPTNPKNFNHM